MNPFSTQQYDLGCNDTFGLTKEQVDDALRYPPHDTGIKCLICGNTAQYKLIPKKEKYNTAQIQDKGYVCGRCLSTNSNINKNMYGARPLEGV